MKYWHQSISFHLRTDSGVPPYLQLAQQIRQAVRMGVLDVGDRLPTVKEVVAELAINPNTVQKAYRELEHEGLVEGRQGVGTFVARRPEGPPPGTQARLARGLQQVGAIGPRPRAWTTRPWSRCCATTLRQVDGVAGGRMTAPAAPAFATAGLGKRYGSPVGAAGLLVVACPSGRVTALVGPNGAGQDHAAAAPRRAERRPAPARSAVLGGPPTGPRSSWPASATWPRTCRSTGA